MDGKTFELYDIVKKLNGEIYPTATDKDQERYNNLKNLTWLVEHLLKDIKDVASLTDSTHPTVKQMAWYATLFLEDIKGDLEDK